MIIMRCRLIIFAILLSMCNIAVANGDVNQNYLQGIESLKQGDISSAVKKFQKAADQGDAEALCQLAIYQIYGCGVEKDIDGGIAVIIKLAKDDNAKAQYTLARCYLNGIGVEKSDKKALGWCEKSLGQGFANAQYLMANCLVDGGLDCLEVDSVKGLTMYKESISGLKELSEQCDLDALCNLAYCYRRGLGIEQDEEKTKFLFEKASILGYERALYGLGFIYNNQGEYTEAVKCWQKCAEQGDASAQYVLGGCYDLGTGVEQSYPEAAKWYRQAAEQGVVFAQQDLGYFYNYGIGVEQSYPEAVKWYRQAAEQGDFVAMFELGQIYWKTPGFVDVDSAKMFFQLAAESGDKDAYFCLGEIGEEENSSKKGIVYNYRQAADLGHKEAQEKMVSAYLFGNANLDILSDCDSVVYFMNKYVQGYGYEFVKVLTDFGIDVEDEERDYLSAYPMGVVAYCERKAKLDEASPKYNCILGLCYFLGYGVERNIKVAKGYINAVANPKEEGKKPYLPAFYLLALSYEYESRQLRGVDYNHKKWSDCIHNAFKCYMRYIISEDDMQLEATKRLKGQALHVVANGYKNGYHVKSGEGGYLDDHAEMYGDLEEFEYYSTMARAKYKNEQAKLQNKIRQEQNQMRDEEILLRLKESRERRLQLKK